MLQDGFDGFVPQAALGLDTQVRLLDYRAERDQVAILSPLTVVSRLVHGLLACVRSRLSWPGEGTP